MSGGGSASDLLPRLPRLAWWEDEEGRSGPAHMAVDECLFRARPADPVIRVYRWPAGTGSFGYAMRWEEVRRRAGAPGRQWVRRWTGGGVVLHGDDLTYTLVLPPASLPGVDASASRAVYAGVHQALARVLRMGGFDANCRARAAAGVQPGDCFRDPVEDDVEIDGRKVAGAGQRRTRDGILHQGSVRDEAASGDVMRALAEELAAEVVAMDPSRCPESGQVDRLAAARYGAHQWIEMR